MNCAANRSVIDDRNSAKQFSECTIVPVRYWSGWDGFSGGWVGEMSTFLRRDVASLLMALFILSW